MQTTLIFTGAFEPDAFAEFVGHRARRLDLHAELAELGPDRVSVAVRGAPELVDAFEAACSLGPINCLVLDVVRVPAEAPLAEQDR